MPRSAERAGAAHEWRACAIGAGVFALFALGWFMAARSSPELLNRDWNAFDRAATRAWRGDWAAVYQESRSEKYPFLYPPFAIWLTLPLGLFGRVGSYLLCAAASLAALALAGRQLLRFDDVRPSRLAALAGGTLASAPLMLTVVVGQGTALYVLAIVTAIASERRGRHRQAGIALAALLLKPNLAVFFVAFLLWRRSRRALEGFACGALGLAALSLIFGVQPWRGFVDALRWVAQTESSAAVANAQVTVLSLFRTLLVGRAPAGTSTALWLATTALVVGLVAAMWRQRAQLAVATCPLRCWGTVALLAVALNGRLYFYDALLLVVPAAGWYLERNRYTARWRQRACGAALAGTFLASYPLMIDIPTGSLIGVCAAVWALLEAADLARLDAVDVDDRVAGGLPSSAPGR